MPNQSRPDFRIRRADWEQDGPRLKLIRRQVFVREQRVPEELEWDGLDTEAVHLLAEDHDGAAIGTARLLPSGQIGRMAVSAAHRRRGIGRGLLLRLLHIARTEAFPPVFLNAQTSALPFYAGVGFEPEGAVFDEAGIPHRRMYFADAERMLVADLGSRRLGDTAGVLRVESAGAQSQAVCRLVTQARTEVLISTPDMEPMLYDQPPVLDALIRLAVHRRGRVPVRVLLADAEKPVRDGHRLIDLSRRFSSAIQIRNLPEELAAGAAPCLLADELGYGLRPSAAQESLLVDFADGGHTRRLRRRFELLWQQSSTHPGLRRLCL
jgi:predicted GNAT family N-acyltransferase